jgi:hypothetical protein
MPIGVKIKTNIFVSRSPKGSYIEQAAVRERIIRPFQLFAVPLISCA